MDWATNKLPDRLPERLPFSKQRLPKRVIFSYILDYVIIVALIVAFYIVDKIPPFHQPFSLDNLSLRYPFAVNERIPVFELCLIVVAAPAVIIAFYTLVIDGLFSHQTPMPNNRGLRKLSGRYRFKDRLWELNCGILGLGLSVMLAFTMTALKNAIGKPRPDIIDRCKVSPTYEDIKGAFVGNPKWALVTSAICTEKDPHILQDGFKSFPSGHSSTAFAGLFYLSLYLAAKLHILDAKGEVWKTFIVMCPTLGAALVAGSRIMDARHHPFDVLFGSAMGMAVAYVSYRQYFPPLSETWRKGRAYPIRSWGRQPEPPQNPTIVVDDDTEPLRPVRRPTDVEAAAATGFSSQTAVGTGSGDSSGNVFRQQISQSQRRRQEDGEPYGVQHSDTMNSSLSTKVNRYQNQMPGPSPYSTYPRRQDTYDYSSSEEDSTYELQRTYTLSDPPRDPVYNPVSGTYTETAYHPPAGLSPQPTPPPPANIAAPRPFQTTGDIGETRPQPSPMPPPMPPQHAPGTST
ncbi:lipid phosphate phosphatase-like protein 1 [Sporormia fimetaria CBS 119925]|uniref:Lipid phosphate phosphatase-like protein 1 n=1 Tax=Sporormia fimetaria CBS 119925 TaxID=1340428 RepID=A0A6A6VE80_9PLEO|nr:lipid phosphate phosphatase-like protein 1 [Sporormia fimetaria CBS 119925]